MLMLLANESITWSHVRDKHAHERFHDAQDISSVPVIDVQSQDCWQRSEELSYP